MAIESGPLCWSPRLEELRTYQTKHLVGICCVPGIALTLPLGVHRPLRQMDTWDSVIHLPASGLGVCHGGA